MKTEIIQIDGKYIDVNKINYISHITKQRINQENYQYFFIIYINGDNFSIDSDKKEELLLKKNWILERWKEGKLLSVYNLEGE